MKDTILLAALLAALLYAATVLAGEPGTPGTAHAGPAKTAAVKNGTRPDGVEHQCEGQKPPRQGVNEHP